jgi:hypothetical protein
MQLSKSRGMWTYGFIVCPRGICLIGAPEGIKASKKALAPDFVIPSGARNLKPLFMLQSSRFLDNCSELPYLLNPVRQIHRKAIRDDWSFEPDPCPFLSK